MLNENVEEDNDDDEDDDEDSLFSNSNVHPRCVILFIFSEFCCLELNKGLRSSSYIS